MARAHTGFIGRGDGTGTADSAESGTGPVGPNMEASRSVAPVRLRIAHVPRLGACLWCIGQFASGPFAGQVHSTAGGLAEKARTATGTIAAVRARSSAAKTSRTPRVKGNINAQLNIISLLCSGPYLSQLDMSNFSNPSAALRCCLPLKAGRLCRKRFR